MQHHFIINPAAGQGKAAAFIPLIEQYGSQHPECCCTIYRTQCLGDAADYVHRCCLEHTGELRFYACGGDGTLSEVVRGAAGFSHAAVGVLPSGTGNDFVRSFLHAEQFQSIEAQIGGNVETIDLIRVNDLICINMINIGFDCNVVCHVSQLKKKPLIKGPLAYIAGVLYELFHKMGTSLRLTIDEKETLSGLYLLCTIAGGRFCGGGFQSSPRARLTDGCADLAVIRTLPRLRFLSLLPSYRTGRYLERHTQTGLVTYRQCRTLQIEAEKAFNVCIDGEVFPFTSLQIQVQPRALRLIVPQGAVMPEL